MDKNSSIKSSYCILPEKRLIVEYHNGVGTLQYGMAFKKEQATNPDFSPEFNLICDLRDLVYDVTVSDIESFVDFYLQNRHLMGKRRNALITQTPYQMVVATLFEKMQISLPQSIRIVSTVGAAVSWVNCDLTGQQVNDIIKDLKKKAVEFVLPKGGRE